MNEPAKELLLGRLVILLSPASVEQVAAVYRFARKRCSPGVVPAEPSSGATRDSSIGCAEAVAEGRKAYGFRWTGRDWEVVFGGSRAFHLADTLGARYLDYLLHRPNEPVSAFELEVVIQPEKAEARSKNSIQPESDPRAKSEYREALRRLQAERDAARLAGRVKEAERLEEEIEALESALGGRAAAPDTGHRAFDNVRKAVRVVLSQLGGGPQEQAFAEHLRTQLSIGFECMYSEAAGRVWE